MIEEASPGVEKVPAHYEELPKKKRPWWDRALTGVVVLVLGAIMGLTLSSLWWFSENQRREYMQARNDDIYRVLIKESGVRCYQWRGQMTCVPHAEAQNIVTNE